MILKRGLQNIEILEYIESSIETKNWQGYNEVVVRLISYNAPNWKHNDILTIEDTDYFLYDWTESEKEGRATSYRLRFYGVEKVFIEAALFLEMDEDGGHISKEAPPLVGTLEIFAQALVNSVNYRKVIAGERVKDEVLILDEILPETDYIHVPMPESNCYAALKAICDAFQVVYIITKDSGKYKIKFTKEDETEKYADLAYGKGKGLYALKRISKSEENVKTILTVLGSNKNLPQGYGKPRLELNTTVYPDSVISDSAKVEKYGAYNGVLILDQVMPSFRGAITNVSIDGKSFYCNTLDFDISGGAVNILTGSLAGYNFRVHNYKTDVKQVTVEPITTPSGLIVPGADPYKFKEGDIFTVTDIPMPNQYLSDAEVLLEELGLLEYKKVSEPKVSYNVELEFDFIQTAGKPKVGQMFKITDTEWEVDREIRCVTLQTDLLTGEIKNCQLADEVELNIIAEVYRRAKLSEKLLDHIDANFDPTTSLYYITEEARRSLKDATDHLIIYIDGAFKDGVVTESELITIESHLNNIQIQKAQILAGYLELIESKYLASIPKTNLTNAKTNLVDVIEDLVECIQEIVQDREITSAERQELQDAYLDYLEALEIYQNREEKARESIADEIREEAEESAKEELALQIGYEEGYEQMKAQAIAGKHILDGGFLNIQLIDADTLISKQGFINTLFTKELTIGFVNTQIEKEVRLGGKNLFNYSLSGLYEDGTIKRYVGGLRLTSSGKIRSSGEGVLFESLERIFKKEGLLITGEDCLVGCLVDIRERTELLVYGRTDLENLTVKYRVDEGEEVTLTEEVVDDKFSFVIKPQGLEMVIGLGGEGEFELNEVMIVHGNKKIDFISSELDILSETSRQAEKVAISRLSVAKDDFAHVLGRDGWQFMVEDAMRGNTLFKGGYIRTDLVDTKTLVAESGLVENLFTNELFVGNLRGEIDQAQQEVDYDDIAIKMGYTSFAQMTSQAAAGHTLIKNGFVNTNLIIADDIIAQMSYIGGVTIGNDMLYIGEGNYGNANTPFYVEGADTPRFSLGNVFIFDLTDGLEIGADAKFKGDLTGATGTFSGGINAGGIKIGINAGGTGWGGFYINAHNYWKGDGSRFRVGGATQYIEFVDNQLNLTVPLSVEKVAIGGIVLGKDAYDTNLHGVKINAHNYWYLDGTSGVFKVGDEDNYMSYRKIGANWKLAVKGDITGSVGTFTGRVEVDGVKIGKDAYATTYHGVSINEGNYWWFREGSPDTFGFRAGNESDYLLLDQGKLKYTGDLDGAGGTFSGALSAATGTFAGSLNAATGTFAGSLSAATGTFAGSLSAATGTFAGGLSAATGTFAGKIDVGGVEIGLNVKGTNKHGVSIEAHNYWYVDKGTTPNKAYLKAGDSNSYISYNSTDGVKMIGGVFEASGDDSVVTISGYSLYEQGTRAGVKVDSGGRYSLLNDFGLFVDIPGSWNSGKFTPTELKLAAENNKHIQITADDIHIESMRKIWSPFKLWVDSAGFVHYGTETDYVAKKVHEIKIVDELPSSTSETTLYIIPKN